MIDSVAIKSAASRASSGEYLVAATLGDNEIATKEPPIWVPICLQRITIGPMGTTPWRPDRAHGSEETVFA
ncbi:hypothetical protein PR370_16015 [Mycobacterium marinum]|uniref:hypothetical protein n=1 Tax=Mycobacterium marinum TaxID=1781 RepID=UPI0023588E56|nr:hypothetical protein [Mycobacterium marinum]MDC8982515.1 hypothetical protein [Mycobacterium marinum]MDC8999029.1 hypothetical protein [Mycobacterium marinum]MDC9011549.1 hypothetical protein [Mycobacterium marinum]